MKRESGLTVGDLYAQAFRKVNRKEIGDFPVNENFTGSTEI